MARRPLRQMRQVAPLTCVSRTSDRSQVIQPGQNGTRSDRFSTDLKSHLPRNQGAIMASIFNISAKRVGGIWFLKIGRFCFSFCLTAEYRALSGPPVAANVPHAVAQMEN
jgi:hypothetical protein